LEVRLRRVHGLGRGAGRAVLVDVLGEVAGRLARRVGGLRRAALARGGAELPRLLAHRTRGAIDVSRGLLLAAPDSERRDRAPGYPAGPPDRSQRPPHRPLLALRGARGAAAGVRDGAESTRSPARVDLLRSGADPEPPQASTRSGRPAWNASSASTAWA